MRRYLREFLSDARVIDISALGRWLLLYLVILPFRPQKAAAAYRQIWTERGSPLLYHSEDLAAKIRHRLGESWQVELAMRYGEPSLPRALDRFAKAGVDDIHVVPLYPQYASASTGSTLERLYELASRSETVARFHVAPDFYEHPGFIEAFAEIAEAPLADFKPDRILFSYHGLPERQLKNADPSGTHCFATESCCTAITATNRRCYRAQCYATTRALVARLGLAEGSYVSSFQSRLGRTVWIRPYTDVLLHEWAQQGIKRVAVFSPAFVADCLETLEEIAIREREAFIAAGGEDLILIPSLNSSDTWASAVLDIAGISRP